jgi:hypothetical protein
VTPGLRLDPARGLVRGVRAGVLTVPAVGSAALAHSSAGGCASVVGIVVAAGVCWPMAVALLGRRASLFALVGWLVLAQGFTHLLLEWLCPDVVSGHLGLVEHLTTSTTPTMLTMHVVAVVLTAAVLGRADTALWTAKTLRRLASWAVNLIRALPSRTLPVLVGPPACPPVAVPWTLRDLWKAPHPVRRGPPALLAR